MALDIKLALLLPLIVAIIVVYDVIQTRRLIAIGIEQTNRTLPFERRLDQAEQHFLVVGDSSGVGVGANPPQGSIAGRLATDFPTADIRNLAVSGSRVKDAIKQLESLPSDANFDLIVIQIGGNDIVRRTAYVELEQAIPQLLELANQHSPRVVQLTSGNVGTSRLLPFGTRWYFTWRTKQVRKIFLRLDAEYQVTYVDLLRKRSLDPYAQNPKKYYSPDFFHPSADGYGDWYSFFQPRVIELLQN